MKSKKKSKKSSKKSKEKSIISVSVNFNSSSVKKAKHSLGPGHTNQIIRKRKLYSPESLQAAYKAVKDSSISVNAAAKQYGVPLTTLRDRVDGRISIETTRPGPPLLMTREEESEIAHFLHTMAKYGYRYTRLGIAEIATDQAVEKGKRRPKSNGLTTKWVDSFINRWPDVRELSFKFKNKTEAEHTVRTYFDEIKRIIDRYKLLEKSDRIFNIMEVNLQTDHSISPEFGNRTYGSHQFKTENVSNTTLIACGSVTGRILPPFFVFQASKLRPEMMRGVPSNVNAAVSDSGKCTPQIFRRYLNEHFLPQAQRFDGEPILLLMDGSRSHMFVGMSEWGQSNNIIFSFIPAHTTHLLQPIEVECADALQKKYESACRRHLRTSSGFCVGRENICELACQAYTRVMTRHTVMHSFKKAGVFPDISSDESQEEMDPSDDLPYSKGSPKSDDSLHDDVKDEVVYTGDLVVGHNQEVTEEEVVTTEEVILCEDGQTEEVVVTPDGQFLLTSGAEAILSPEGHLIISGSEVLLNSQTSDFSHLQLISNVGCDSDNSSPIKFEPCVSDSLIESQCIINNGKIISNRTSDASDTFNIGDASFNSSDLDYGNVGKDTSSDIGSVLDDSRVKIIIKSEVLDLGTDEDICHSVGVDQVTGVTLEGIKDDDHSHVLQQVFDIIQTHQRK